MDTRLPLSTLLSQALIAYTIEFDNHYEQRAPHTTTIGRLAKIRGGGPWLVSQPMWTLFLRHIGAKGTPVHEIQALACLSERGTKSRLHHLEWWQYVTFAPDPSDTRSKPRYRDLLVHLTPGGKRARDEWKPLNSLIDKRWRSRFSKDLVEPLKTTLRTIADGMEHDLPDYLPIVDYPDGMRATLTFPEEPPKPIPIEKLDLSALLSRALLALTLEFEEASDVSLTIAANVLRVVEEGGTSLKELPARGGVAKEGVSAAVNFLKKNKFVVQGTDKAKMVRLTPKGKAARSGTDRSLANIEKRWAKSFGAKTMSTLRETLEGLDVPGKSGRSRLADAIEPPEKGWRWDKRYRAFTEAFLADPRAALPHHPMVLHRGGFPDGS